MKSEVGDIVQFSIGNETITSKITKIDEEDNRIYMYDFNFKENCWVNSKHYNDNFIGKVHPTLIKLWRLDEDINL